MSALALLAAAALFAGLLWVIWRCVLAIVDSVQRDHAGPNL